MKYLNKYHKDFPTQVVWFSANTEDLDRDNGGGQFFFSRGRSGLEIALELKKNCNKAEVTKRHRRAHTYTDCLSRCTQITEENTSDRGRVEVTRGWQNLHV